MENTQSSEKKSSARCEAQLEARWEGMERTCSPAEMALIRAKLRDNLAQLAMAMNQTENANRSGVLSLVYADAAREYEQMR